MNDKYQKGDVVFERIHPSKKLIIRLFQKGIYYCKVQERRGGNDLVYFERDLMADTPGNGF